MNCHRIIYLVISILISPLISSDFDYGDIPIQENGRIKPLDSFARNHLLAISSKRTLKPPALPVDAKNKKMTAVDWFFDIALNPYEADKYKVFKIQSPEIVGSLGLIWDTDHLYNRNEILIGLQNQIEYISSIQSLPEENLELFDKQMLQIYSNVIHFQELCFSFSCLINLITIEDKIIASAMGVEPGDRVSYYDIMKKANALNPFIEEIKGKDNNWTETDIALNKLIMEINEINQDQFARLVKIIPPENLNPEENWLSPWELMDGREIGTKQQNILNILSNYLNAKKLENEVLADSILSEYKKALSPYNTLIQLKNIKRETWYNNANLFV